MNEKVPFLTVLRKHLISYLSVSILAFMLGAGAAFASAEDRGEFEQILQENFPGSYMLYTNLSSDAQKQVFKEYKRADQNAGIKRFSKVIAKILELAMEEDTTRPTPQRHKKPKHAKKS
ncbi:MAG: hypothetical protein ACE5LB_09785 [Acidiferrobacterales bacterium]